MGGFLIPIQGLTVENQWELGSVTLLPHDDALQMVSSRKSAATSDRDLGEQMKALQTGAVGLVSAPSIQQATDELKTAVDVLRVYQQTRNLVETTMFGMHGDVHAGTVTYLHLGEGVGVGWRHHGQHLGWTFTADDRVDFLSSSFETAARAIGAHSISEGQTRALLGIEIASQAILEARPSLRIIQVMMAAEALLLDRASGAQTLRLAQRCAYFVCGLQERKQCGRQKATCPILGLNPSVKADRAELTSLQERGNRDPRWRCSEWHRALDWYDDRSEQVHGGGRQIGDREARKALWWLVQDLLPPVLDWLGLHPVAPLASLQAHIDSLPPPPDWDQIIGAQPRL